MLTDLYLKDLRIFQEGILSPQPGINVISGENGAGKTTVLEAIYLLARGRSFRHREAAPLIREGQQQFIVRANFLAENGNQHKLGMRRGKTHDVEVRLDGKPAKKRSEILSLLPVQLIGPEPQQLLCGPPDLRRSFLDAGLFHVEHRYLDLLTNYNRTLGQRNALLRAQKTDTEIWDEGLVQLASQIDVLRHSYMNRFVEELESLLIVFKLGDLGIDVEYRRGWPAEASLKECLNGNLQNDLKMRYTSVGPHRADLQIRIARQRSGRRLSRGQQKMLACALVFAQSGVTRDSCNRSEILLFDDMPAELDESNRRLLITHIGQLYNQAFVTTLANSDLPSLPKGAVMFHVEHSQVSRVA